MEDWIFSILDLPSSTRPSFSPLLPPNAFGGNLQMGQHVLHVFDEFLGAANKERSLVERQMLAQQGFADASRFPLIVGIRPAGERGDVMERREGDPGHELVL